MKLSVQVVVIFAMGVITTQAVALPRFASRTGAQCQSCHVNPSGGGMRQAFGVQYGRENLPVPTWYGEFGLDDFSTKLTDFVSIGADFRTLYFYQQNPDTGTPPKSVKPSNAFFQMQGNLDLSFHLAKRVVMYLAKGLYSSDTYSDFEVFGLLSILPANGYVKIGKFIPNYGIKMDDHRIYVRTYTGFSPELVRPELTGAEFGILPGPLSITGGLFNSVDGFGIGTGNDKALLGRVEGMFKATEYVHLGLGANVFTKKSAAGVRSNLYGGFGSISFESLTILGEADLMENKLEKGTTTGIVTFVEADYVVTPGLDLKLGYDFYDPDKDLKTGSKSRYTFGCEFFPIAGVEVRSLYHFVQDEPIDFRNNEFQLLVHFYL